MKNLRNFLNKFAVTDSDTNIIENLLKIKGEAQIPYSLLKEFVQIKSRNIDEFCKLLEKMLHGRGIKFSVARKKKGGYVFKFTKI